MSPSLSPTVADWAGTGRRLPSEQNNETPKGGLVPGRSGASLEINGPVNPDWAMRGEYDDAIGGRPNPLLLYDLWNDPYCLHSLHEHRPDLVEKYTSFLEEQYEAHLALKQLFEPSGPVPLRSEQLEMLRALGYIR